MGFLDHSTNNIIVDAVLTDVGREKLASATASENFVAAYAFADDEIDYTMIKKYGTIVGKENAAFSDNSIWTSRFLVLAFLHFYGRSKLI